MGPFIQEQGQSDYLVSCIGKEVTVYGYIKWAVDLVILHSKRGLKGTGEKLIRESVTSQNR